MLIFLIAILLVLISFLVYLLYKASNVPIPKIIDQSCTKTKAHQEDDTAYLGNSFAKLNEFGIYEVYAEGNPFEMGYAIGQVLKPIKYEHEKSFIASIKELVPSETYLQFLKYFVGIFNRNLHQYIKSEYKEELYGLSLSSSTEFDYIAPPYLRVLNYHAAHDIGHALQNIGLVGCTSFVVKNNRSANQELLLARNLDFSPSEDFNKLKALYFINPDKGNKYISYSWPGFIGVVSGMNEHGLCIVLHAAKSAMRFSIGTPVSIIAREIMQDASNIEEARKILQKRQAFVSELFLVVSAKEKTAVVFEKEPKSLSEYQMEGEELICANHLLSEENKNNKENIEWRTTISSAYREKRMKELLDNYESINPKNAAEILRDIKGCNNENIGLQNENAINQLAAHHGVIFKPESLDLWVAANPYMMGEMVAYNLETAFDNAKNKIKTPLHNKAQTIPKDSFLDGKAYARFLQYKSTKKTIQEAIKHKKTVEAEVLNSFKKYNPLLFLTHEILGDYYIKNNDQAEAKKHYATALKLSIPTKFEQKRIEKKWQKI